MKKYIVRAYSPSFGKWCNLVSHGNLGLGEPLKFPSRYAAKKAARFFDEYEIKEVDDD